MKLNFNPFVRQPKIVPVSVDLDGETLTLYFRKLGYLTPKLNPTSTQDWLRRQADLQYYEDKAVETLAATKGISEEDARQMLTGYQDEAGGVDVLPTRNIASYLDEIDRAGLAAAQASVIRPNEIATLFIQQSIAYAIVPVIPTDAKQIESSTDPTSIGVKPLAFALAAGDLLGQDRVRYELAEPAPAGSETIRLKSLPAPIESDAALFLIDCETQRYKIGAPDWTLGDTESSLPIQLVNAIQELYMEEGGFRKKEAEPAIEGNAPNEPQEEVSGKRGKGRAGQAQLTGSSATSESSPTELATPNSNSKALATSLAS